MFNQRLKLLFAVPLFGITAELGCVITCTESPGPALMRTIVRIPSVFSVSNAVVNSAIIGGLNEGRFSGLLIVIFR